MEHSMDREKVIKGLECCLKESDHLYSNPCNGCPYDGQECIDRMKADALALLKEQEVMSPNEFKNELLKMFSSIWDCEIDHSIFQDTVGELMSAVMQLYTQAVKWE